MAKSKPILCSKCGGEITEQKVKLIMDIDGMKELIEVLKECKIPKSYNKRIDEIFNKHFKEVEV